MAQSRLSRPRSGPVERNLRVLARAQELWDSGIFRRKSELLREGLERFPEARQTPVDRCLRLLRRDGGEEMLRRVEAGEMTLFQADQFLATGIRRDSNRSFANTPWRGDNFASIRCARWLWDHGYNRVLEDIKREAAKEVGCKKGVFDAALRVVRERPDLAERIRAREISLWQAQMEIQHGTQVVCPTCHGTGRIFAARG